ncbi:MAG: hypothetical protein ABIR59_10125 [Gemmatimonadales bacterium]
MFARAHAGLADAYCIQANFGYRLSKDVCPKSTVEANRALALDSTLAEAHATLGFGVESRPRLPGSGGAGLRRVGGG